MKTSMLRTMRVHTGLSQAQLGARVGLTGQQIGNYELGKVVPNIDAALAISSVLGVPPEKLFPMKFNSICRRTVCQS